MHVIQDTNFTLNNISPEALLSYTSVFMIMFVQNDVSDLLPVAVQRVAIKHDRRSRLHS